MYTNCLPVALLSFLFLTCQNSDKPAGSQTVSSADSPIEGNWELIENRVNGQLIKPQRSQQFKSFHDGHYSFLMYNRDGSFYLAAAGPYSLEGNQYKETVNYCSDTTLLGTSDWQEWQLNGDTLVFSGFKKVTDRNGKDITSEWSSSNFVEKRVRIRSNPTP